MGVQDDLQRTVLPIPDQPRKGLVTYDAKDPENKYPADYASCGHPRGAERPAHPDRRRRLWLLQRSSAAHAARRTRSNWRPRA